MSDITVQNDFFQQFTRYLGTTPTLNDIFMDHMRQGAAAFDLRAIYKKAVAAAPDGRGQPVLVLPGYSHDDDDTAEMRRFLGGNNFMPYELGFGTNRGPNAEMLHFIERRTEEISALHNGRKVAVVGHSLGGMIAKAIAHVRPDLVSKVVVLGSPIHAQDDGSTISKFLIRIKDLLKREGVKQDDPLKVPLASIYASHDGILGQGFDCINKNGARVDNIRIDTSHLGLLCHPSALVAVLDRLAQPSKSWKPFAASDYPEFKYLKAPVCVQTAPNAPRVKIPR